jgi:histone deacetylase 11
LPIVFSKRYDITLLGLQKLHPFDSEKYGKVYRYLVSKLGRNDFYTPESVSQNDLLTVHTKQYLASLRQSQNVAIIAEMGLLALAPNFILQSRLLTPMRYATGGTILGAQLARQHGWAINLSGGYHHAKAGSGGGFCYFADIPIAAHRLWQQQPDLAIMVIDLDAHQGNGYEAIFKDDPRVRILDVYNHDIYPRDIEARQYIDFDYPVRSYIKDTEYLNLIETEIGQALDQAKPSLVIYNAGSDIFEEDPLGQMGVSKAGVIKRDEIVFGLTLERNIPILMLLSGGYTRKSTALIGESIENLLKKVISIDI